MLKIYADSTRKGSYFKYYCALVTAKNEQLEGIRAAEGNRCYFVHDSR